MRVAFECQQCGKCCTKYSSELTAKAQDIVRWRKEDRRDILKHVRVLESGGVIMGGDIWLNPRTGRKTKSCPFLKKTREKFYCLIHSTKPLVCRKYPFTGVNVRVGECPGIRIISSDNRL